MITFRDCYFDGGYDPALALMIGGLPPGEYEIKRPIVFYLEPNYYFDSEAEFKRLVRCI